MSEISILTVDGVSFNLSDDKVRGSLSEVEMTPRASKTYAVGDYLIYQGRFYKVVQVIDQNSFFEIGTNIIPVTVGEELELKASLESPTFSGSPKVPTADVGTRTTQIASTAYVQSELDSVKERIQSVQNGLDGIDSNIGDRVTAVAASTTTAWMNAHITNTDSVLLDSSLTVEGAAADAKAVGDAIDELPKIVNTDEVGADFDLADSDGNVLVRFEDGHIKVKNFDSSTLNDSFNEKIDIQQDSSDVGKALVVGEDGKVSPADISIDVDTTLSIEGAVADAKAVGDALDALSDEIVDSIDTLSDEIDSSINELDSSIDNRISSLNEDITNLIRTPEQTGADFYVCDPSGNVLAEFRNGHIHLKNFDSADALTADDLTEIESAISSLSETVEAAPTAQDLQDLADDIQDVSDDVAEVSSDVSKLPEIRTPTTQTADLYFADSNGNVLAEFSNGHVKTKNFDSSLTAQDAVKTVNGTRPDANGNVNVTAALDPTELQDAVDDFLTEHPVVASAAGVVSVADYGAVGDGVTDDSAAIQNAVNSNYDVYFESNKTYFLGSTVTIDHDIYLHGGENTVIKIATPEDAAPYTGISFSGTLKKTTTLTSNYTSEGTSDSDDNISNRFTLADMTDIEIGDILVIQATDQYYAYSRRYYYLGGVLEVNDIYEGHLYTNRNLPFDITLTNHVSVNVYSAPSIRVENLKFIGDLDAFGSEYSNSYASLLYVGYCKNSFVFHCAFDHFKIGMQAYCTVNLKIEDVLLSKSRYANTAGLGDGYSIAIESCTNTVIDRVINICSQSGIDLTGHIPNLDTYILRCQVSPECRGNGIGLHENSYNIVIEDCVLAGIGLYGPAVVNRCQFFRNMRGTGYGSITVYGFENPKWARYYIKDCTFPVDAAASISLNAQVGQDYVRAWDSVLDEVIIENCRGGQLNFNFTKSEMVLSHTANRVVMKNWKDCKEVYHTGDGVIKSLEIEGCNFLAKYALNKHAGDVFWTNGIFNTRMRNTFPMKDMMYADVQDTYGERYVLPEGIQIDCSSESGTADFIVCGENYASDNNDDYSVGSVSWSVGNALTRTADPTATAYLSTDASGHLVYSVPSGVTSTKSIFPKCMICANEDEGLVLDVSAIAKNTGSTAGTSFRLYIVIVDKKTGLVTYHNHGSNYGQATAQGLAISHRAYIPKGSIAMWYLYVYSVIAESETTFEDVMVSLCPIDRPTPAYTQYVANKRTGDGALQSIKGQNNLQSSDMLFNAKFSVDFLTGK